MIFGHKMGQNPYVSIISSKFDDVTVTLSLIVLSQICLVMHVDTTLFLTRFC